MPDSVVVSKTEFVTIPGDQANQPATLSVAIGDDQAGGTAVTLDGKLVEAGGVIKNLALGHVKDLKNKELGCTTTVEDINAETNRTSVTYTLRFGTVTKEFPYDITVSTAGGRAVYIVTFELS